MPDGVAQELRRQSGWASPVCLPDPCRPDAFPLLLQLLEGFSANEDLHLHMASSAHCMNLVVGLMGSTEAQIQTKAAMVGAVGDQAMMTQAGAGWVSWPHGRTSVRT